MYPFSLFTADEATATRLGCNLIWITQNNRYYTSTAFFPYPYFEALSRHNSITKQPNIIRLDDIASVGEKYINLLDGKTEVILSEELARFIELADQHQIPWLIEYLLTLLIPRRMIETNDLLRLIYTYDLNLNVTPDLIYLDGFADYLTSASSGCSDENITFGDDNLYDFLHQAARELIYCTFLPNDKFLTREEYSKIILACAVCLQGRIIQTITYSWWKNRTITNVFRQCFHLPKVPHTQQVRLINLLEKEKLFLLDTFAYDDQIMALERCLDVILNFNPNISS